MDEKTLNERINRVIAEKLHCAIDINPLSSFKDDLGADSLDRIELIMAFEDEFGIEISDEDADRINTVEDTIGYIKSRTEKEDNLFF